MVDSRPIAIRYAEPADAAALAELMARTYRDTFATVDNAADMALHLARAYGPAQQRAEIGDPGLRTVLAVAEAGELVAFAQIRRSEPPACVPTPDPVEIWRFYVDRPWHGRGVAALLMRRAVAEAVELRAGSIWLGVWEHNHRAQAFYRKAGFRRVGAHDFLFGADLQTDDVMVLHPIP